MAYKYHDLAYKYHDLAYLMPRFEDGSAFIVFSRMACRKGLHEVT